MTAANAPAEPARTPAETPRDERARAIATRTAVVAAALGAVLSPIPLADEAALLPIYALMAARIGRVHGLSPRRLPWRPMLRSAATGLSVRAGMNLAFALLPGISAIANASSAATLTVLLGRWFDEACRDPKSARAISPATLLEALERTFGGARRRPA
jgi:uncharacterized protein (DUF697 family)